MTMADTAELEGRINVLEQQMADLLEKLHIKERGARQGLLQFVAAIEEFTGEPRTADLRKEAKRDRMRIE